MNQVSLSVCLVLGLAALPAWAQDEIEVIPAPIVNARDLAVPVYQPSYDRLARAGCPHLVAPWARLTYGPKYSAYNVGGAKTPGILFAGPPVYRDEGTFGVDYDPWYMRVALRRSRGYLYQGGIGQYEPDRKNLPIRQGYRRR